MKIKRMIRVFIFLIMFTMAIGIELYALGDGLDLNKYNQITTNNNVNANFSNLVINIYSTIVMVIKVVAVGGVVYTGVKYMMAGSGDKGAIKQSLIYVVIGTVFVFAADAIINFIVNSNII